MPASPLFLPRCFAEKLGRTACLALATVTGTFSLLLATATTNQPPLAERALFMSRQARWSRVPFHTFFPFCIAPPRRPALCLSLSLSLSLSFSLSLSTEPSEKKRTRQHRLFDSSPFRVVSLSLSLFLRCPGETVIDERERHGQPSLFLSFFLPSAPPAPPLLCTEQLLFPSLLAIYGSQQTLD